MVATDLAENKVCGGSSCRVSRRPTCMLPLSIAACSKHTKKKTRSVAGCHVVLLLRVIHAHRHLPCYEAQIADPPKTSKSLEVLGRSNTPLWAGCILFALPCRTLKKKSPCERQVPSAMLPCWKDPPRRWQFRWWDRWSSKLAAAPAVSRLWIAPTWPGHTGLGPGGNLKPSPPNV